MILLFDVQISLSWTIQKEYCELSKFKSRKAISPFFVRLGHILPINNYKEYAVSKLLYTGDNRPDWRDLNRYVIAQHAFHWNFLGAELGLPEYDIKNISLSHPQNVVNACEEMLRKWLQVGFEPTWGKLDDAINMVMKIFKDDVNFAGNFHKQYKPLKST